MLNPVSAFPGIAALFFAGLTAFVLARKFGAPSEAGRFVSIDGLRGYLAFFVFLHHSCIWYFYLRTGLWKVPPSNLYTNLGQGSVVFFFMITGFLFFTKILNDQKNGTDWLKLYVSRVLRIMPLYYFAMLVLFLIVVVLSKGSLNDSLSQLLINSVKWLSFTMLPPADLNGIKNTFVIMAGVTWSLRYEWLFYLSLPLIAYISGNIRSKWYLALGIVVIGGYFASGHTFQWHILAFVCGICSALLVRFEWFCAFASKRAVTFIPVVAIGLAASFFPSSYALIPFLLLFFSFALIAGGNTLFGALSNEISLTLGEMAYSIYLLQGPMLFLVFNFLVGTDHAKLLPATGHWLLIILITPVFVSICFLTFCFIERPAMRRTVDVTNWLRGRLRMVDVAASGDRLR